MERFSFVYSIVTTSSSSLKPGRSGGVYLYYDQRERTFGCMLREASTWRRRLIPFNLGREPGRLILL